MDTSSWFKDDSVITEGSLYLVTEMDPLFLFIPLLQKQKKETNGGSGHFYTIENLLNYDKEFAYHKLKDCISLVETLPLICDTQRYGFIFEGVLFFLCLH